MNYYAEWAEKEPEFRDHYLEQMHFEVRIFNMISDKLPERYKKKLVIPCTSGSDDSEDEQEAA